MILSAYDHPLPPKVFEGLVETDGPALWAERVDPPLKALSRFLSHQTSEGARQELQQIPVPVFGSAPSGWQNFSSLFASQNAHSTAALVMSGGEPVAFLLLLTYMTVVVRIVDPAADAVGHRLHDWIQGWRARPPWPPQ